MNLQDYLARLLRHNWAYYYSDASATYRSGEQEQSELEAIAKESKHHLSMFQAARRHALEQGPLPALRDFKRGMQRQRRLARAAHGAIKHPQENTMQYGNIAKAFIYEKGATTPMEAEDGVDFGEGKKFAPGQLDKANAARERVAEQLKKKWAAALE